MVVRFLLWFGYVHVDDVDGYVENLRLRFYLKKMAVGGRETTSKVPATDEVYQIMVRRRCQGETAIGSALSKWRESRTASYGIACVNP